MSTTLEVTQFSDLVKKETGKLFSRSEWRDWVYELHVDHIGVVPDEAFLDDQADHYRHVIEQIDADILRELATQGDEHSPEEGELVAVMSTLEPGTIKYAITRTKTVLGN